MRLPIISYRHLPQSPDRPPNGDRKEKPFRKSLALAGDGDELDLVRALERVFELQFTHDDLAKCLTLGDIEEVVWRRMAREGGENRRCMGAMAFYALRRVLRDHVRGIRITPSTRLQDLSFRPKTLASLLEKREGLRTQFRLGYLATLGWLMQLGWPVLLWSFLAGPAGWALPSIASVILGMVAIGLDQGAFMRGETVGDAAKRLACENYGVLAAKGGRVERRGVWESVRQVVANYQGFRPCEIGRDTRLIS